MWSISLPIPAFPNASAAASRLRSVGTLLLFFLRTFLSSGLLDRIREQILRHFEHHRSSSLSRSFSWDNGPSGIDRKRLSFFSDIFWVEAEDVPQHIHGLLCPPRHIIRRKPGHFHYQYRLWFGQSFHCWNFLHSIHVLQRDMRVRGHPLFCFAFMVTKYLSLWNFFYRTYFYRVSFSLLPWTSSV